MLIVFGIMFYIFKILCIPELLIVDIFINHFTTFVF